MVETIICPICQHFNAEELEQTKEGFLIYKCLLCGTTYSKELKEFAESRKFDYKHEITHSREEIKEVIKILELVRQLKKDKDILILEIRCGDLRHLIKLRKKYPETNLFGFDLHYSEEIKELTRKYNIKLLETEKIFNNQSINFKFDIIFLFHVIEHTENPSTFLFEISSLLKEDGFIILSFPNPERLSLKIFRKENFDYPPYHYYRFSVKSLDYLFNNKGLKTVSTEQYKLKMKYDFYIYEENIKILLHKILQKVKRKFFSKRKFVYKKVNTNIEKRNGLPKIIILKAIAKILITLAGKFLGLLIFIIAYIYDNLLYKKGSLSMVCILKSINNSNKIYVFDFDGTLIKTDSFIQYLKFIKDKSIFLKVYIKLVEYFYSYNIISNTLFKVLTWYIIPKKFKSNEFIRNFIVNCLGIETHNIFLINELRKISNSGFNEIFILTATYSIIVKDFFNLHYEDIAKRIKIFGSSLDIFKGYFLMNLRGNNKVKLLKYLGIDTVNKLYTDSILEDYQLSRLSKETIIIRR